MIRKSFLLSSLLLLGTMACEKPCEPIDVDTLNAIYLRFDRSGGGNSFSASDLDSVYLVRYEIAQRDSFLFPVDTFNLYEFGINANNDRIRLSRGYPIGIPEGPPYYSQFMYRILSRDEDWQVRLQGIEIDGSYVSDCDYDARSKRFVLNDDTLQRAGSLDYVPVFKD